MRDENGEEVEGKNTRYLMSRDLQLGTVMPLQASSGCCVLARDGVGWGVVKKERRSKEGGKGREVMEGTEKDGRRYFQHATDTFGFLAQCFAALQVFHNVRLQNYFVSPLWPPVGREMHGVVTTSQRETKAKYLSCLSVEFFKNGQTDRKSRGIKIT